MSRRTPKDNWCFQRFGFVDQSMTNGLNFEKSHWTDMETTETTYKSQTIKSNPPSHSSKTCHLVVDRAGEKFKFEILLDASNLPAHEFGALFVLGNLWKRLKSVKVWGELMKTQLIVCKVIFKPRIPIHEGCQVRIVGQAVWHHQLVLEVHLRNIVMHMIQLVLEVHLRNINLCYKYI